MNIQTVIANLLNTIEGKELLLKQYREAAVKTSGIQHQVNACMRDMIEINLIELNNILTDCIAVREADIDRSWRENPDRSGGQFTQDEINDSGKWI